MGNYKPVYIWIFLTPITYINVYYAVIGKTQLLVLKQAEIELCCYNKILLLQQDTPLT